MVEPGIKILSDNRHAGHNYHLLERFEAGLALTGTEVKAAKDGRIQLKDSFAEVQGNEAWLLNAHIGQYSHGNRENHEPTRRRKLLLHREEIDKLLGKTREKGPHADSHQDVSEERAVSRWSWPSPRARSCTTNAESERDAGDGSRSPRGHRTKTRIRQRHGR